MIGWILLVLLLIVPWGAAAGLTAASVVETFPWVPLIAWTCVVAVAAMAYGVYRFRKGRNPKPVLARPKVQSPTDRLLQARFTAALRMLRRSPLRKPMKKPAFVLPWIAVVGPKGSGKTTAIGRSGLTFPPAMNHGSGGQRAVDVTGPTSGCDFWFSNKAVIIDTAGSLSESGSDASAGDRAKFLSLLKKHRRRQPLNGLLLTVAAEDLLASGNPRALSESFRVFLDEVNGALGVRPPVQLVVTKLDRLAGFAEVFGELTDEEVGRALGVDLELGGSEKEIRARVERIVRSVRRFAMLRLSRIGGDERGLDSRSRVARFPEQFEKLGEGLVTLLAGVMRNDVFSEPPNLVGLHLTSALQDGRCLDLAAARYASLVGSGAPERTIEPPASRRRAYFVRSMLRGVVDTATAAPVLTAAVAKRRAVLRYGVGGAVFLTALFLAAVPSFSWLMNRSLLEDTHEIVADTRREESSPLSLLELSRQDGALRHHEQNGAPLGLSFGMYAGDQVRAGVRAELIRAVRAQGVDALLSNVERDLRVFVQQAEETPVEDASFDEAFDTLKFYSLLTAPSKDGEPKLNQELREWLVEGLASRWAGLCEQSEMPAELCTSESARLLLHSYVRAVAEAPAARTPVDERVMNEVSAVLRRRSEAERVMSPLVSRYSGPGRDVTLVSLIGDATCLEQTSEERVLGAYTRTAWESGVFELLRGNSGGLRVDAWVLGERQDSQAEFIQSIRFLYFTRYVGQWRRFVDSLRTRRPRGEEDALELTRELTRGAPSPIHTVFQAIGENAVLEPVLSPQMTAVVNAATGSAGAEEEEPSLADRALASQAQRILAQWPWRTDTRAPAETHPAHVSRQLSPFFDFAGMGAEQDGEGSIVTYEEQLRFLRDGLHAHLMDPARAPELAERLRGAQTVVRGLIEQQPVGSRPNFEALLWPPIEASAAYSKQAMAGATARSFCAEVVRSHRETVWGTYPFNPRGEDLSLGDLAAFYAPAGTLWGFYDEALSQDIAEEGVRYRFANSGRGRAPYRSSVLGFLNRSRDVTRTFFPPGSADPRVEIDVRIRPQPLVAHAELTIDGQSVEYQNGPTEWKRITWPGGDGSPRGASLSIRGQGGLSEMVRRDGEWGLFRFFEMGTIERTDARRFTVRLPLHREGLFMEIDVRTARGPSPFFLSTRSNGNDFLSPVRAAAPAPEPIVGRGRRCTQ